MLAPFLFLLSYFMLYDRAWFTCYAYAADTRQSRAACASRGSAILSGWPATSNRSTIQFAAVISRHWHSALNSQHHGWSLSRPPRATALQVHQTPDAMKIPVHALTTRLDYCSRILADVSGQRQQKATV